MSSLEPTTNNGFDITAYITRRLDACGIPPSSTVLPKSFDQTISPLSLHSPSVIKYKSLIGKQLNNKAISGNSQLLPYLNSKVKLDQLKFAQDEIERIMVMSRPVFNPILRGGLGAANNSSSTNLTINIQQNKRPGPDNADFAKPGKMLKASQSATNMQSLSQSAGPGAPPSSASYSLNRTMSASASLSSFGDQVSSSNIADDVHISFSDLKIIMKTICEEFWNYEYGHIEIKKAFRSRINRSTCKGLFACLETYAEEDSSLSLIRDRLNKDFYQRPLEFETDFRLMFYNIIKYFPVDHPVSNKAKQLQALFESKWASEKARVSKRQ